ADGAVRIDASAAVTKFARCSIVFEEIHVAPSPQPATLGGSNMFWPSVEPYWRIVPLRFVAPSALAVEIMKSVGDLMSERNVSGATNSGLVKMSRMSSFVSYRDRRKRSASRAT